MNSFKKEKKIPFGAVWLMNTIYEYKGKEELYKKQSPQLLKTLTEAALIQSVESSNRIEGVTVEPKRLNPLVFKNAEPRNRSEEEISGYKKALKFIHKKYSSLDISPKTVQYLHKLCVPDVYDAGKWKKYDNNIIRKNPDGSVEVIYRPLPARETPAAMRNLCLYYNQSIENKQYPPLYAIACLILDFLSIHPFRDGNGRVLRLLTLLALYQQGFNVGRYISLERIVENSKEAYYAALNNSSIGWRKNKHNLEPWLYYFLNTIITAYREFEKRALSLKSSKGMKTNMIVSAIDNQADDFSISDIAKECPGVSRDMIKLVLRKLKKSNKIVCLGRGQSAKWKRIG